MAEQLRGQGKDTPARVAEQVADRAESFGGYLTRRRWRAAAPGCGGLARRQPWLVAAGGLPLGFAASRFLKASSSRRYQSGDDRSSAGHGLDDVTWATGAPPSPPRPTTAPRPRSPKPTWSRRPLAATLRPPRPHHASDRAQRPLRQPPRPEPTAVTVGRRS